MTVTDWREEQLGRRHDRASFDCGAPELNDFLQRFARQNAGGGGAKSFVAVAPTNPSTILAYYTIAPSALDIGIVPSEIARGRGAYELPVFRLGRLAVGRLFQGEQLGSRMLFAAARRALAASSLVGGMALAIDAKNLESARWYRRFGALPLLDQPLHLILPFSVILRSVDITDHESASDH